MPIIYNREQGGVLANPSGWPPMHCQSVRIGEKMSDEFIMFVVVPILLCPVGWISLKILGFYDNCP